MRFHHGILYLYIVIMHICHLHTYMSIYTLNRYAFYYILCMCVYTHMLTDNTSIIYFIIPMLCMCMHTCEPHTIKSI